MPKRQDHFDQATHNDRFAAVLVDSSDGPFDWAVTVTFYAALHYLESWLVGRGVSVTREAAAKGNLSPHSLRINKATAMLPLDIAMIYTTLRQQSELARYLTTTATASGGRGPELTLPQLPNTYYSQTSAKQLYEELQKFKSHLASK
jgi:hypothetical protein